MASFREDGSGTPLSIMRNVGDAPLWYNPVLSDATEGKGTSDCERGGDSSEATTRGQGLVDTLPYFPSSPGLSTFLVVRQHIQESQAKPDEG